MITKSLTTVIQVSSELLFLIECVNWIKKTLGTQIYDDDQVFLEGKATVKIHSFYIIRKKVRNKSHRQQNTDTLKQTAELSRLAHS